MTIDESLVDTWRIHARIVAYFFDAVPPEGMDAKGPKGKSVRGQFAHIHNVRRLWLASVDKARWAHLPKLDDNTDSVTLRSGLDQSGRAIEEMLAEAIPAGRVKGFKPHPAAFLGYLISHEAHHRGMAELTLRIEGCPISDKVSYGIWEWGAR